MSQLYKNKYRIPSARLQTWNYADSGMYFITICTKNRECYFGDITPLEMLPQFETPLPFDEPEYQMNLTDLRMVAEMEWLKTPQLRPDMNLELAEYAVMPNHFHGIIIIGDNQYNINNGGKEAIHSKDAVRRDAMLRVSTGINDNSRNKFAPQTKNLASVIRGFKSAVTTYARHNQIPFDWQARFHDHIITTNDEYFRIGDYISNNVQNWEKDKFYK